MVCYVVTQTLLSEDAQGEITWSKLTFQKSLTNVNVASY